MSPLRDGLTPLPGPPDADFIADFTLAAKRLGEPAPAPQTLDALGTVAAVSPFLKGVMLAAPEDVFAVLSETLEGNVRAAIATPGPPPAALRKGRRRLALAVALADLCAGATVEAVTEALSTFADHAVQTALALALHEMGQPLDPARSGLFILAMGKLGGRELNFSSDVDLIALYDPAAGLPGETAVRVVRRMTSVLQDRDGIGYVFRVDLRLRPDPGSTQAAVSTRAALAYYRGRARAWERQAMIKARLVAGDQAAGARYLSALNPSLWHAGYDFNAIDEVMALREHTVAIRGAGTVTVPRHDVKVGRGGIREIEFFVQGLQRVAGGRDPQLRGRATVPMLAALAARRWIAPADADALTAAYRLLRKVEHRLQMVDDAHTHTLPDADGLPRIARMMRLDDLEGALTTTLNDVARRVRDHREAGFSQNPLLALLVESGPALPADIMEAFATKVAIWQSDRYQCLRSEAAQAILLRLLPRLEAAIAASADPAAAVAGLDAFFARLTRGVDFLSRLDRQAALIPVIVLIVTAAPRLAEQIATRGALLDVLVDPAFYGKPQEIEGIRRRIAEALAAADTLEEKLDALRVVGQEQKLLVDVRILTGSVSTVEAGAALTDLAGCLVAAALDVAQTAFAARHGTVAGGGVALIALGSFGSGEMTPTSDLDLVFIYNAAENAGVSDGEKGLAPGPYFARLAQRFIAALSAPTTRGRLYEVDLRLRPSGRSGPLATHIRAFEHYHAESAWVWEHMALTRARFVAGDAALGERAMAAIRAAVTRPRDPDELTAAVLDMRSKLDAVTRDDARTAPGGLTDIEFIAQYLQLRHGTAWCGQRVRRVLRQLSADGALGAGDAERLIDAHRLLRGLMLAFATAGVPMDLERVPAALCPIVLRAGDAPDMAFLAADLAERRQTVRAIFERVVGPLR
ncbi:MAG: bifunctional [glutamine synthetase] adenylyltransferase/[glutamine synthetase]-adenylyl-L-tyrosine phosphorylase [Pseudomonadota bacterium]